MSLQTTLPPALPGYPGGQPPQMPLAPLGGRPQPPAPRRSSPSNFLTTRTLLGRFRVLAAVVIGLASISLLTAFWVLSSLTSDFEKVVTQITPSIAAAQELGQALEDMDSRAADYQLTARIDVTNPDFQPGVYGDQGLRTQAWTDLQNQRRRVDNALAVARNKAVEQNDGYTAAELDALNRIDNRFYDYFAQINLMRYELDQGHKEAALANYKAAEDILVGNLGQLPRDANGNSQEKVLKDSNWNNINFTCAGDNCPGGQKGQPIQVSFNPQNTYEGIAANVHKLSVISQQRLDATSGGASAVFVFIPALLVLLMAIVISVYYAVITHRVINLGFGLAVIAGLAMAVALIVTLNNATNDYNNFKNNYVQVIVQSSNIQQVAADANADLSRLLLSPDSPGLDSTQPALTSDVKKAFSKDVLITAYGNKTKQVEQSLAKLAGLMAQNNGQLSNFCEAYNKNPPCPTSNGASSWTKFTSAATELQNRFDQRLLAAAIQIAINPNTKNDPGVISARQQYNSFNNSITTIYNASRQGFDRQSCSSLGESEFGNACSSVTGGYLNLLQMMVWIVFPLMALLVSAGIWLTTRLF